MIQPGAPQVGGPDAEAGGGERRIAAAPAGVDVTEESAAQAREERFFRLALYVVSAAATLYECLAAAAQLPDSRGVGDLLFFLVVLAAVGWMRVQLPDTTHSTVERHRGLRRSVLAAIRLPVHFLVTWHARPARRNVAVLTALFAPLVAPVGLAYVGATSVRPRYVQLQPGGQWLHVTPVTAPQIVYADFRTMVRFVRSELAAGRGLPEDVGVLYERLAALPASVRLLSDPFTGDPYYYEKRSDGFVLWSTGPDRQLNTSDDLSYGWPGADSDPAEHWVSVEAGSPFVPMGIVEGAVVGWDHQSVVRVARAQYEASWERRWEDSTKAGRYELDCTASRYRLLGVIERDARGAVVREEAVPRAQLTWWEVVPRTDGEGLFRAVCGFAASRNLPVVRRP